LIVGVEQIYPGHGYNGTHSTVEKEKEEGFLKPMSKEEWKAMMGRDSPRM